MKIQLWAVGKSHELHVQNGVDMFTKRLQFYYTTEWKLIPSPKNAPSLSEEDLKKTEGEIILSSLQPADVLIALDEKGKMFSSPEIATLIQNKANESAKTLVFLIGGAYGLSEAVLKRADVKWSLSKLVFPHQLVRLILAEQVYRACTIIRNEKYHHQ
ncbi:23S rRNA (pseudouridine(1915)-N(3))-methyltransferase RlmH [soil metagenome]